MMPANTNIITLSYIIFFMLTLTLSLTHAGDLPNTYTLSDPGQSYLEFRNLLEFRGSGSILMIKLSFRTQKSDVFLFHHRLNQPKGSSQEGVAKSEMWAELKRGSIIVTYRDGKEEKPGKERKPESLLIGRVCPEGFTRYPEGRKCFRLENTRMPYKDALTTCQNSHPGTNLATIRDKNEDDFVINLIKQENGKQSCYAGDYFKYSYYIGGVAGDYKSCSPIEWHLAGGKKEPITYSNYQPNQPDCYKGEEFCIHYSYDLKWNDIPCRDKYCSICEYRLP